ncbi:MAG TPA: glycerol kinase GlpK [Terriglobia bacterium]|jgi:glycerol kinase|nr:glycerol kinase GlpK [Terriglobia bacterium]
MPDYILALDQGTTSSRAVLFDREGHVRASAAEELRQYYPQPGWVEHDAGEIWGSQRRVAERALAGIRRDEVAAIGITNQRETVVLWDRRTSEPVYHAIVWQCRRTAAMCDRIRQEGFDVTLRERTGLVTDAYFSGTKIAWTLENVPGVRERAERGELACGTIDTWLIWQLTGGRVHATDVSNASRTLLFNIHTLAWDDEILAYFKIPRSLLPEIRSSSEIVGVSHLLTPGHALPLAGVAGDQQASLFGHQCFEAGSLKNTYGTGCFLLMNTAGAPAVSQHGLLSTVAWRLGTRAPVYAIEGSVFVAGAAIQWLRDGLQLVHSAEETAALAAAVPDTGGVYFVPAFVGLGAPYWDAYARGTIVGITRGTNRQHLARAALEAMAYQTRSVVDGMTADSGIRPQVLRVDGGAARNDFMCQFQADILGAPVERPATTETTSLGAAYLAGLATGFWKNTRELATQLRIGARFEPAMPDGRRQDLYADWQRAVERAKGWAKA